jgi:signal transduction histidine kinase
MRRLHLQFYLAILATIALFVVASMIFWHFSAPMRRDAWGFEAAGQFATAVLPAPDATPSERQQKLDQLREHMHANLALYDANGQRIAASGDLPEIPRERILQQAGSVMRHAGMWIVPLEDGRRLVVRLPRDHRRPSAARMLAVPGAFLVALALGAYPIARRLTARLARLQSGVEQWGEGNLAARVDVEGRDEVAALARSFNESAVRIEELVNAHKMLLANCSHELRTPLARIRLGIESLSARPNAATREEIARSIAELDQLIGEMLLASRLGALHKLEHTEDLDLLALVAEEAAYFEREVEGRSVVVSGDPSLLRRMVRNLLDNAAKHAGGATRIHVDRQTGGAATIEIEDHGPGVQEIDPEKVFEPFYRSGGSGTGLGLAIVRQIAQAHDGNVRYTPGEAGGSVFIVTLPVSRDKGVK